MRLILRLYVGLHIVYRYILEIFCDKKVKALYVQVLRNSRVLDFDTFPADYLQAGRERGIPNR